MIIWLTASTRIITHSRSPLPLHLLPATFRK